MWEYMPIFAVILLVIFLLFRNMRVNGTPLAQVKTVIRASEYDSYEQFIINQMNLDPNNVDLDSISLNSGESKNDGITLNI